jgi:N-acyl-D-aspartate/D-glutamate deacylase
MRRLVLSGGLVVDGTGAPGRVADVVIEGDVVVAVDPVGERHRDAVVKDVGGLVVAPGFIDVHSHADNAPLLAAPDISKVLQGVTTEVVGNCGLSLGPRTPEHDYELSTYLRRLFPPTEWQGNSFADLLEATDAAGYMVNYAPLVGHGTLRIAAMGFDSHEPTARERARMRLLLEEALDAGAVGLSSGLIYPPGNLSRTDELIDLAGLLGGRQAIYASHIRNEASGLLDAVQEAIEIGREAGVRVEISHHKAIGRRNWGLVRQSLALAAAARASGTDVRFDVYPYIASSTVLTACLPAWLNTLPDDALLAKLQLADVVDRLRADLAREDWDNQIAGCGGFTGILVATTRDHRFEGNTLHEIAETLRTDGAGALVHVLLQERLGVSIVAFGMDEADLEAALTDPLTSIGSDGLPPGLGGKPHPRMWGTFPRVLARYVRERGILTLEEAIRKMTSLPAETFGLLDKGRIAPGYAADIVTFQAETVEDRATYADPLQPPSGLSNVFINGVLAVDDGHYTGARQGRRLRSGDRVA